MYNISKYHGCGNNFVIMQEAELAEQLGVPCGEESAGAYAKFAARVCDESVGVGADGFIIVRTEPVLEMVFLNRDGSRAPMCGNGIRCFAHYCRDHKIRTGDAYPVKTLAGDMVVEVKSTDPFRAQIDIGSVRTGTFFEGREYTDSKQPLYGNDPHGALCRRCGS